MLKKNKMVSNNLKYLSFLFIFLMSFTFVFAQGCADEGWMGYSKLNENKTITITCPTCNYINFTAVDSNQEIFLDDVQMDKSGDTFSYIFLGEDLNKTGDYQISGYSNLDVPLGLCFDVTPTGDADSISYVVTTIILLLILFGLTWGISIIHKKTDFDAWDSSIANKHKNMGQTLVNSIVFSLFKNVFIWYYCVGWIFVLVLKDIVYRFNSVEVYSYFTLIANVYSLGFLLVIVFMIGYTISYMRNMINILTDNDWGIDR